MPWQERDRMSLRLDFVAMARADGVGFRELCRRFGISRKTGYKWLARFEAEGPDGLADRSRRPHSSLRCTPPEVEAAVLEVRALHPAWGGRKIHARLRHLGLENVPAPSTITGILHRHERIRPEASAAAGPMTRFEHAHPNDLWQMDFKGYVMVGVERCHPLTILDDHSRYALGVRPCRDQQTETVQGVLIEVFRLYGLPWRMLMDNGSPWGSDDAHVWTPLAVWLVTIGMRVTHGRAYHPQTQGKNERFNRTLKAELLSRTDLRSWPQMVEACAGWEEVYNHIRPHEALGMAVPASRYRPSVRPYPEVVLPFEYGPDDQVRRVQQKGRVHFQGRQVRVPKAFAGYDVAFRPTGTDGVLDVFYRDVQVVTVDLRGHHEH